VSPEAAQSVADTHTLIVGMVNNKADDTVNSGDVLLRCELVKYLNKSEMLLR
jgi:hypothetical protein